jgi:hypothetical protein
MVSAGLSSKFNRNETQKRAAGKPAALKVDNREASNRVDRSHSVSKQGQFPVINSKA